MYKASTTPSDPVKDVLDALTLAAQDRDLALSEMLGRGDMLIHGTTHAINAIITGSTAFLTTAGHPDILVLREGGQIEPVQFCRALSRSLCAPRANLRGSRADQRRR